MMQPSRMNLVHKLTFAAAIAVTAGVLNVVHTVECAEIGDTNETIGAAKEYFSLDDSAGTTDNDAIFKCELNGARCVFQREDYEKYDIVSGQETSNSQGAVWSASNNATDELRLSTCVSTTDGGSTDATTRANTDSSPTCLVVCTANCTCTYENGTDCTKLDGPPAKNDIVETDPPVADKYEFCPQQLNLQHCPALMQNPDALAPGLENEYDCYNFCGGIFISSCDLEKGSCGTLNCTNATSDGTITGRVLGCNITHYNEKAGNSSNNSSSSATVATFRSKFYIAGAGVLIGLFL